MSDSSPNTDSPLSITASITGILTFLVAILAAAWLRISSLRTADTEYFRVKTALNWYKTESAWINDLVATQRNFRDRARGSFDSYHMRGVDSGFVEPPSPRRAEELDGKGRERAKETEMYLFVLDQLGTLEERLLEVVTGVEVRAEGPRGEGEEEGGWGRWTFVPRRWGVRTEIAVQWLPVRTKALELVRQREALGSRVLFAQLAMISS